jgi:PAS domain S-box-containing protein
MPTWSEFAAGLRGGRVVAGYLDDAHELPVHFRYDRSRDRFVMALMATFAEGSPLPPVWYSLDLDALGAHAFIRLGRALRFADEHGPGKTFEETWRETGAGALRSLIVGEPLQPAAADTARFQDVAPPLLVADVDAHYVDANQAATALLGYSREDIRQLRVRDVVASRSTLGEVCAGLSQAQVWHGELDVRSKDGAIVHVRVDATVIPGPPAALYLAVLRPTGL